VLDVIEVEFAQDLTDLAAVRTVLEVVQFEQVLRLRAA